MKDVYIQIFLRLDDFDLLNVGRSCPYFLKIVTDNLFWLNKILYKYPCLHENIPTKEYRKYYFYLEKKFSETNLEYLSAIAQHEGEEQILLILDSLKIKKARRCLARHDNDDNEGNKIESIFYLDSNNNLQGQYLGFYENGETKEIANYRNGFLHGERILYGLNNRALEIGRYIVDHKDGKFFYYDITGLVEIECEYRENKLDGVFRSYIDGNLYEELYYKDSITHGRYRRWNHNRSLKEEGTYNYGVRYGSWFLYNNDGNLLEKRFYP